MQAIAGIFAALYSREKTGKGQHIEISITDGMLFFNWVMVTGYLINGMVAKRGVLPSGGDMAWMQAYKTADGSYIALSCLETYAWSNLCKLLDREQYIPEHYATPERQREIFDDFSSIFATKNRHEWLKLFDEADVAGAPVNTIAEALEDPHIKHRGMIVEVDHPKKGKIKLIKNPFNFSDTPVHPRARPPLYGENTLEILERVVGASDQEIDSLRDEGVIE